MGEFIFILGYSFGMFAGCMLASWIPMAFTLSQKTVKYFTIFGAGLLVGTALVVIIPEGVDTMYHNHHEVSTAAASPNHLEAKAAVKVLNNYESLGESIPEAAAAVVSETTHNDGEQHEPHKHKENPHQAVGMSLLLGFVFMLLVDQIGGSSHHAHSPEIRLDELTQSKLNRSPSTDLKAKTKTATIGLVVHAMADGVALGAAMSTERSDLQVIVFLAIMLHKAPAAFGLSSYLLHEGLEPRKAKKHLLAFALAAPCLAIITFLFLNQSDRELIEEMNATGIAMLL